MKKEEVRKGKYYGDSLDEAALYLASNLLEKLYMGYEDFFQPSKAACKKISESAYNLAEALVEERAKRAREDFIEEINSFEVPGKDKGYDHL